MVRIHKYITVSSYLNILLRKNIFCSSSSTSSSTKSCSPRTKEPNSSAEHSAIQKDSVQCTVGAVDFSCLLSTTRYSPGLDHSKRTNFIDFHRWGIYGDFSFLKFLIKPDSLLLEDQRSETSSEGNTETTVLFIFLNLDNVLFSFKQFVFFVAGHRAILLLLSLSLDFEIFA